MSTFLRRLLAVVAGIVVLVIAAIGVLVLLVNPDDYRDEISRLAQEHAGVELTLAGELGWSFYPVLGFDAQDVGLALQPGAPALVKVQHMAVGVELLPLLSGKVVVDALDIDGLQADLRVDAQGGNNWTVSAPSTGSGQKGQTVPPAGAAQAVSGDSPNGAGLAAGSGQAVAVEIPRVTLRNAVINYQDKAAKAAYTVDVPLLELSDISLDEAFPVLLEARVRDAAKLDVALKLTSRVRADLAAARFAAQGLDLEATLNGMFASAVTANLQGDVVFDQKADTASIVLDSLHFADVQGSAKLDVTKISSAPAIRGEVNIPPFDLKKLFASLGMTPPVTADSSAMQHVALEAGIAGTPESISLKPFRLELDGSNLNGEVRIADVAKQSLRFDLALDRLDADRYLSPEASASAGKAAPAAGAATGKTAVADSGDLLPVDTLRGLDVQGKFRAGELVVKKVALRDLAMNVDARNGNVQLSGLSAKLLDGSLSGSAGVDVRSKQPEITTRIALHDLQLDALAKLFSETSVLSGKTSLDLNTTTRGNDMDVLLQQAVGQLNLNLAEGVLHGVNLSQVASDALRAKLGDFAVLMPDYEQRLPKALKGDTRIRNLLANMKVENGHLITPPVNAVTDAGALSLNGDIDLAKQGFDYRFGVVLNSLADHKYLAGTEWPVRCKGGLDIPAKDWCRPDMNAIGGVLQKAASLAAREKVTQKIAEELGAQGASEAEVKQQVKEKAKEKLNEEIGKQLNKLFRREGGAGPASAAPAGPAQESAPTAQDVPTQ